MTSDTSVAVPARPLRRDAERNRQRILVAAAEVFAEHGLEASLDDIARHAGVGVGTVYRRFADKEALIEALFEERIAEMARTAGECLALPAPADPLCAFLERICAQQAHDRGLHDIMTRAGPPGTDRIDRCRDAMEPLVTRLLAVSQARGHIRRDVEHTDVPMLVIMMVAVGDFAREVRPDLWRRYLQVIMDGLRDRRSGTTPLPVAPLAQDELEHAMRAVSPYRR
jgi:AcrR family transcriptional regulator